MRFRFLCTGLLALAACGVIACGGDADDDKAGPPVNSTVEEEATPEGSATVGEPDGPGVLTSARPRVGQPAPDFALYDARDGTLRRLSDYKGKAIVLNWYASWCGPCKSEIPEFKKAAEALPDSLTVVGVNWLEEPKQAQGILDLFFARYPAVLDEDGKVGRHYRVQGLPVTYFIDADFVIRAVRIGEVTEEVLVDSLEKAGVEYTPEE